MHIDVFIRKKHVLTCNTYIILHVTMVEVTLTQHQQCNYSAEALLIIVIADITIVVVLNQQ